MTRMYMINNASHVVFFPYCANGLHCAKEFRRTHTEFKHKRIKDVIQALPSMVKLGEVMERT